MPRDLPNLDWLRVFAATATTESFALAANELGVTPGAVSQRIKSLEAFLGVDLFQRYAQSVRLTNAGRQYARTIQYPLEQLREATLDLTTADTNRTVRLTVLPAFAQLWLGPRVSDFHQQNQAATLEIWADPAVVDLRASNFDVAIRYANPPFPGCDHYPLLHDELIPVAAPAMLDAAVRDADGWPIGFPLLLDTYWSDDFDRWLRTTRRARPAPLKTQTFSLYSMVIDAALNGRGFMVGHTALIGELIAQGRLVPLAAERASTSHQFHLLSRSGGALGEPAQSFIEWVLAEARTTQAATTAARASP
jgi:LysR family glycine cleavage system transcriptional activator